MKIQHKTLNVTKEQAERLGIDLSIYGNAGPYPCISGMKAKYWGLDAFCVKCGAYVYKVPEEIYNKFKEA